MATSVALPKNSLIKKARISAPSFSGTKGSTLLDPDTSYINTSIRQIRNLDKQAAIRALTRTNGMFSTAVHSYVQIALTEYSVMAYSTGTQEFDENGTLTADAMIASLDTLWDYSEGYADKRPLQGTIETLLLETILTGACSAELVLNKLRLPDRLAVVPMDNIEWVVKDDKTKYPQQSPEGGGDPINLNLPTFFVEFASQQASTVFNKPMLESALNSLYIFSEFIEDVSRVVRKSGHDRLIAKINQEKVIAAAPQEIRADPEKMKEHMLGIQEACSSVLGSLEPDEAIVAFDSVEYDILSDVGAKSDYVPLMEAINGMVATSLKTMPSALGLRIGRGSQSLSNTESMLYLRQVSSIRRPVEALLSRALTLAARLQGQDVYVKFKFKGIDLRPDSELEAYKTMEQSRILEQLSYGFLSDEEAAAILGTGTRPAGAPPLSGTFFHNSGKMDATKVSPNSGAQEAALTPTTPTGTRGSNDGEDDATG